MKHIPELPQITRFDALAARPGLPERALRRLARFATFKFNGAHLGADCLQWAERAVELADLLRNSFADAAASPELNPSPQPRLGGA